MLGLVPLMLNFAKLCKLSMHILCSLLSSESKSKSSLFHLLVTTILAQTLLLCSIVAFVSSDYMDSPLTMERGAIILCLDIE